MLQDTMYDFYIPMFDRITSCIHVIGTSFVTDTACSSALFAFHCAVKSILRGEIEAAVVAGVNLCLKPEMSLQFQKLGATSDEGFCRTFDADGITYPSYEMQKRLMQEVYQECKLSPSQISYVEAHGTGTIVGDPVEVSGIADILCYGREEPLWIGSVKSNIGHTESSSGNICLFNIF
ncbi:UNVERIFIED_CONTAM: Fatty acid synthase [Trichonephila clavipes]